MDVVYMIVSNNSESIRIFTTSYEEYLMCSSYEEYPENYYIKSNPYQMVEPHLLGSVGAIKEVDAECIQLLNDVRNECEAKAGRKFETFEPVYYKTQLVNGINFFIKVKVGCNEYIHVRAHKSFKGEVTLWGIQEGKKLEDELTHFD